MRFAFLRKFTSLVLFILVLASAGFCPCLESHAKEQPAACSQSGCVADAGQSPACPDDGHSTTDHDAACSCTCHLLVTVLPIDLQHAPVSGKLSPAETFTALPEVYLSKFIPPQNLA
jgi:hypothetical protein